MNNNNLNSKKIIIISSFIAVAIALTVWIIVFGFKGDIFKDSTSDVGGKHGHYVEMVFLGFAFFVFYLIGGLYAIKLFGYKDKIAPIIYIIGCVCYLATCILPFMPDKYPIWADVHDIFARISVGVLLVSATWFIGVLYRVNILLAIVATITGLGSVATTIALIAIHGTCIIGETIIQLYLCWFIVLSIMFKLLTKKANLK